MDKEKIFEGFKEYLKSQTLTKSTITGYFLDIKNFLKWQEENNSNNVKQFIQYLRKNEINPKTVNHHLYALKKFIEYLILNKLTKEIKINGMDDKLFYPIFDFTYINFSKADIDKFINEIKKNGNKRYYALVLLMAKSGLKISEALNLKTENITGNTITIINEERGRERIIKASKEVILAIQNHLKNRKGESLWLFNSNKSSRLDRTVVNRFFKEFSVTPKQLRQYFIIQCIENEMDMTDISRHAGIKSLQWMFSRYNSPKGPPVIIFDNNENKYYEPEKHKPVDINDSADILVLEIKTEENYSKVKNDVKSRKQRSVLGIQLKEKEKIQIKNWLKFEKEFSDYLDNIKTSNRTQSGLKHNGKVVRATLEEKPEYKAAFRKICDKLSARILKFFKPMYTQGYIALYDREIIEIANSETSDEMLILLYESIRRTKLQEPVKEAKKVLGI